MTGVQDPATRVLVVDDQELVREGICALLGIQPGVVVGGSAGDGAGAVGGARARRPDVVLMDVRMPGLDGVAATALLRRVLPACKVVMLTTFADDEYVTRALRAGAVGYLLKNLPAAALAQAVRRARAGVAQFDQGVTAGRTAGAPARELPPPRETEGLRLICAGATNKEIAARLYLSEGTVKNHISRVLSRLGLRDRTQAATRVTTRCGGAGPAYGGRPHEARTGGEAGASARASPAKAVHAAEAAAVTSRPVAVAARCAARSRRRSSAQRSTRRVTFSRYSFRFNGLWSVRGRSGTAAPGATGA
ncbi:response regulator [Streptomyces galbus]|uniref:response regulator n=1 Tax=Streptomyces galbus TaxID=33898 RepID=UPI0035E3BD85